MTRRKTISILLVMALFIAGCAAAASWLSIIGNLLPLAAQVATQFLAFANKGSVNAQDQELIQEYTASAQNILATISNAVKTIQSPADTSTIQKIDALLKQLQNESNALLASLQVKDPNTIAFVNAMLADAADLISLVPVLSTPGTVTSATHARIAASVTVQMEAKMPKAKSLQNVFQARLASLPK